MADTASIRAGIKTLLDTVTGIYAGYAYKPVQLTNQSVPSYYIVRQNHEVTDESTAYQHIRLYHWEVVIFYNPETMSTAISVIDDVIDDMIEKLEKKAETLSVTDVLGLEQVSSNGESNKQIGGKSYVTYSISFAVKTIQNVQ